MQSVYRFYLASQKKLITTKSKHVLNAQVAIRSPCCTFPSNPAPIPILPTEQVSERTPPISLTQTPTTGKKWFDCAECHHETESHTLKLTLEMVFACKKCRKCFRKEVEQFEEADEYCPHCDNHFVLDAAVPKPALTVEGDDARVNARMLKDDRVKDTGARTIFDPDMDADKLG